MRTIRTTFFMLVTGLGLTIMHLQGYTQKVIHRSAPVWLGIAVTSGLVGVVMVPLYDDYHVLSRDIGYYPALGAMGVMLLGFIMWLTATRQTRPFTN